MPQTETGSSAYTYDFTENRELYLWISDAERFVSEMQRVDNLSAEQRKSNYAQLMAQYKEATRNIEICP